MSKGEATRERILDRAVLLAATVGLEGLSLGDLAKATSMSKSGLFAHFDSKEDLQLHVLETARGHFVESVVAPAIREPRGEPRVRALFENWLTWEETRTPGGCPFVAAAHELDDRPGLLRDALFGAQSEWVATIATAAGIAVDEGHFSAELDVEQFAYEMYALFLGFHFYHRLLRDPASANRARASFERLLENSS